MWKVQARSRQSLCPPPLPFFPRPITTAPPIIVYGSESPAATPLIVKILSCGAYTARSLTQPGSFKRPSSFCSDLGDSGHPSDTPRFRLGVFPRIQPAVVEEVIRINIARNRIMVLERPGGTPRNSERRLLREPTSQIEQNRKNCLTRPREAIPLRWNNEAD